MRMIILLLIVILVIIAIVAVMQNRDNPENTNTNQKNTNETQNAATQLNQGTVTYASDDLGITFTYNPRPADTFEVTVTERENKIYVHGTKERPEDGKMIEVFSKSGNQTLSEAIRERFLTGFNAAECFVQDIPRDASDPRPASYVYAEISYPAPANTSDPFWLNASKCPQTYSKTNAVQYFMANTQVPTKYVFLQLGQDSITDAGTPERQDWSGSIRIME